MSDGAFVVQKNTSKRGRIDVCGSFTTANTSAPTTPKGDGTKARTDVGTFTVTLPQKYGEAECLLVTISGGASTAQMTYSAGVLTITTYTSGSAADTNALRVNYFATFNKSVVL
jgi:hypothetical protein